MAIKRIYILLLFGLLTVSCRGQVFSETSRLAPWPSGMGKPPETAPVNYKEGWYDGCYTGLSTMNKQIYKSFYGYKQNYSKISDEIYYQAWKDAYTYCRQYSFRFTWDPLDRKRNQGMLSNTPLCVICPNEQGR
jgi:hypothetical protein